MAGYDVAALRQLATTAGLSGSNVDVAAAVAMAESGGNPAAISVTGDYGLWQINARSWPQFTKTELLTPAGNAKAMAIVSTSGRGWNNWTTYRNGSYRKYLEAAPSSGGTTTGSSTAGGGLVDSITGAIGSLNPLDPGGAAGAITGSWVEPLLAGTTKLLLGLTLGSAGIALVGIGITRLGANTNTGQQLISNAGTAASLAALA